MKKLLVFATAAFLFTGFAFSQDGDGKKCSKDKACCKKDNKEMKACCKKDAKDMKDCKMKDMKNCGKKEGTADTQKN